MADRTVVRGFMCLTDWEHELGQAAGGTRVYASEAGIRRDSKCVDQCGLVEVEVSLVRIVQQANWPQ